MGEFKAVISEEDGEEKLIAAANYLVKEIGSNRNLTNDSRKVLAVLLSKLSRVVTIDDRDEGDGINEIKQRLNVIAEKIMNREADESMIWDSNADEANEYLNAVNGVRVLIERLESFSGLDKKGAAELLRKAHDVLQTAMTRLEDEFRHVLVENQLPSEPEHTSFRSSEADGVAEDGSVASFSAASTEDSLLRNNSAGNSGEIMMDLVNPDVIPDLKNIANAMVSGSYDRECIQIYTTARKDALDVFLLNHEIEKMSIEDVLRMDWSTLNANIKKWVRVMRNFVRLYLSSEKWLSSQILGNQRETGLMCFADISKAPMMQLLNFAEAVSLGPRQPEKLIRILDMYEVATELAPDVDALFSDDASSAIRTEYWQVMKRLEDCARSTFLEFKNAIASETSNPPLGGAVHRLTSYVMNYLMALMDFSQTLDSLLKEHNVGLEDLTMPPSPDINPVTEQDESADGNASSEKFPAMTLHFYSITSALETNLLEKSRFYRDAPLQHFFLLNNIHYMTRKVMYSELKHIFGDTWTRKRTWKFQQHAMEYRRATWVPILALLREEGTSGSGSGSSSGLRSYNAREKFQSFYAAFEDVYKTQTAWLITDEGLREELRTSASHTVIQAYWTFYSRHKNNVSERHIKYSTDDLERLLLDLFAGCPKSLNSSHRR